MSQAIKRYLKKAKRVLDSNWNGSYTVPSRRLYPHQWNWDSGFIAIGYSHYDTERAMGELKNLFRAQWRNGMLPQIVFNKESLGTYFPEPDFWQTERSPDSPRDLLTSGITMPPVHALSVLRIYNNARDRSKVIPFLEWIYPRLLSLHRYLYRERDPEGVGLVYIRHPWESGMDNSPTWDLVLKDIRRDTVSIPPYRRLDLDKGIKSGMRPRNEDYDRFIYLVDLFRRLNYDEGAIRRECPFIIYGPLFNSVLQASNEALIKIGEIIKGPVKEVVEWHERTAKAISGRLYHEEHGIFDAYDVVNKKLLEVDTASGFMPLFSGSATPAQARRLYEFLNSSSFCALHQGNCHTVPNYDVKKEGFDRTNYWRGPVWININWMLAEGLKRYGYIQKADSIKRDILELPMRFGFYEYYDSFNGRGYGSEDFSWTAALFIDTAYETYIKTTGSAIRSRFKKILLRDVVLNYGPSQSELPPTEKLSGEMLSCIKEMKSKYYDIERGTVDYGAIRDSGEYRRYRSLAAGLRDFEPDTLKDDRERLAFWINLYNSIVIDAIIRLDVRSSVKEIVGFFRKVKYIIGGRTYSPDDIEHGILRANGVAYGHLFRHFGPFDSRRRYSLGRLEPRIHFALVCGSRSCAPIKFYTPEGIYDELEKATVNFINSSEVIVVPEEKKLFLSMIFKWYERDFGGLRGVVDFIQRYLVDDDLKNFLRDERSGLSVEYLYYDWRLNM